MVTKFSISPLSSLDFNSFSKSKTLDSFCSSVSIGGTEISTAKILAGPVGKRVTGINPNAGKETLPAVSIKAIKIVIILCCKDQMSAGL